MICIAREVRDHQADFTRLADTLNEVDRYDMVADPVTGEMQPVPVYAVQGLRLSATIAQQEEILRRMRLLVDDSGYGYEATRRLAQAKHETVEGWKAVTEQREEAAEAQRRSVAEAKEDRINSRAQSLKRLRTNAT
jgi:hypothetical protein